MKEIKIRDLWCVNFKALRNFQLSPNGHSISVYGRNGTGKSTLALAMSWLLFGCNTAGEIKFDVRSTDEAGIVIPDLDTSVKVALDVDGITYRLGKSLVWKKNRKGEVTGNDYIYSVNDDAVSATIFSATVAEICKESAFKALTNVQYIETLHWQEMRRLLLKVVAEDCDRDMMMRIGGYEELRDALNDRDVAFRHGALKKNKTELEGSLKSIGGKIEEAGQNMPADADCIAPQKGGMFSELGPKLTALQNRRSGILAGGTIELQEKIVAIKNEIARRNESHLEFRYSQEKRKMEFEEKAAAAKRQLSQITHQIENHKLTISQCAETAAGLKARHIAINAEVMPVEVCNMGLSAADHPGYDAGKALAAFNASRADRLKALMAEGATNKARREKADSEILVLTEKMASLDALAQVETKNAADIVIPEKPDHSLLELEIASLELKITEQGTPDTVAIDEEIEKLEKLIALHNEAARNRKSAAEKKARIVELDKERKATATELSNTERLIALCVKFQQEKMSLLTDQIEAVFSPLTFRLQRVSPSGAVEECCDVMMQNQSGDIVPYRDLSTGERLVAGVAFIRALSEVQGVSCPIFLDNAESLTIPLPDTDAQVIKLYASLDHDVLTTKS
jgi:exonuclease SbcC